MLLWNVSFDPLFSRFVRYDMIYSHRLFHLFPHHWGDTLDFLSNTVKTHLQLSSHMNSVRNYGDRVLRLQFAEPIHVKYISWSPHQSKTFLIAVPLLTLPLETEGFVLFFFSLKALFPSTVNGIFKLCWNVVFMFMWIIFWNSSLHSYWKSKARDPRRFLNSARVQKDHVTVSPHDGMCTPLPSPPPPVSHHWLPFCFWPSLCLQCQLRLPSLLTGLLLPLNGSPIPVCIPPSCPSLIILLQKQIYPFECFTENLH